MQAKRKAVFNEINITPLTDIFLVLLIIMMVVAPMLNTSGLKLSVPSMGPDSATKEEPKTVRVAISDKDQMTLDGEAVPLPLLSLKLRELKTTKPDGVVIAANAQSSHDAMTKVMDAAQSAGITKIAVIEDQGAPAAN
jgi:biopolymer transport protein ExbD